MENRSVKLKMKKITELFTEYKIYPGSCYGSNSPVRVFRKFYPDNHYGKELEVFLSCQDYLPTQRGADLPWWGKDYFSDKKGFRVMVIGQDSLTKDVGSIVFFAHLIPVVFSEVDYEKYIQALHVNKSFAFSSWERIKELFKRWTIDFNYLYITDGMKVYRDGSWRDRDFDTKKSKDLLEKEIDLCNPDLIVILGASPLSLLDGSRKYAFTVEDGKVINIRGRQCVVAPFPIGQGHSQSNFGNRLSIATHLIKSIIH